MKRIVSLFLVFLILALAGNLSAKERRGVDLILQITNGQQVKGELIAVKEKSLLLMDSESGSDVSVYIYDVIYIKIIKKSNVELGVGLGILAGAGTGAIIGYTVDQTNELSFPFGPPEETESQVVLFAIIGGFVGALAGGITGVVTSRPEKYKIAGQSPEEVNSNLDYLRSLARVTDYN